MAAPTAAIGLSQRQAKFDAAVVRLSPKDPDPTLLAILKQARVISCTLKGQGVRPGRHEAVVSLPTPAASPNSSTDSATTQFHLVWQSGDSLTITNAATTESVFEGSASETNYYRGESVYLVNVSQSVNKLTPWLAAHGVPDCEQPEEPPWSSCPPYDLRNPEDVNGEKSEDDEGDDAGEVVAAHPDDPHRNPNGNNFTCFLATLCEGLFDQSLGDDMATGMDGSLLFTIVFNQRPMHWNN